MTAASQFVPIRERLLRGLAASFAVAATAFAFEFITEKTLVSEVQRHMAARLFAPYDGFFYGQFGPAEEVSRTFAVVNFGKPSLERLGPTWPIAYGQHARILESLRRSAPKAVFIDFHFQSARQDPTITALETVLRAYCNDGIPVFLAAGAEPGDQKLRPELESLVTQASDKGQPCIQKVSVTYEPSEIDRITWTYRLRGEAAAGMLPSAALALAEVMAGQRLVVDGDPDEMGLVWAGGSVDSGPSWKDDPAGQPDEGQSPTTLRRHYCRPPAWDDVIPLQNFLHWAFGLKTDSRPLCPRHDTVEARLLTSPKSTEQADALDARIRGRAVLYGGSLDANEFVASPLHGDIPGVYLHAQAADNLVRFGRQWRSAEMGGRQSGHMGHALTFLTLLALAIVFIASRALLKRLLSAALVRMEPLSVRAVRWAPIRRSLDSVGRRVKLLGEGAERIGARWPAPLRPASLLSLLWLCVSEVARKLGFIGLFYVSLLVAIPMSFVLEHVLLVSVIGYGSLLALCLLAELLQMAGEFGGNSHRPHRPPTPGPEDFGADPRTPG